MSSPHFHLLKSVQRMAMVACLCTAAGGCAGEAPAAPQDLAPWPDGFIINGHPFAALGQVTVQLLSNDGKNTPSGWAIYLADEFNGCSAVMRNFPNTTYVYFRVPQNPIGTFDVNSGNTVFAVGSDQNAAEPTGGKIQVNSHQPRGTTAGTYDVIFKSGEHLAGVFSAELCE